MSSDVLTRVHYLLFSPEYHLIMPKVYISTFAKSTTIQAARIQMVDDLDDYPELQHIMPPLCSLSLLQLPGNEAMMELLQTASKKRPTKVVAFLAQKSLDGSFLPEVLSGELYFATILCPNPLSATLNLTVDYQPVQLVWAAALSASPDPSTNWTEFRPTPSDLSLNGIEMTDQLQGPALELKEWLHDKPELAQKTFDLMSRSPLGLDTSRCFEAAPEELDMGDEEAHYQAVIKDFAVKHKHAYPDPTFLTGSLLFPFSRAIASKGSEVSVGWKSFGKSDQKFLPVSINGRFFLYSLYSDFSLWMENQPELLLVVSSDDGPTLSELLFQGASVISFVNWIHDKGMNSSPKFTLPLIYVDNAFHALIYVMREHDDKFLYTQIADLNLNQLSASIRFLKFLYRYAATRSRIDDQLAEAWARCISLQTGSIHCVHGSRLVDNVNVHRLRLKPNRAHLPYGTGLPLLSVHDDSGGIFRIRLGGTSFVIKKVRGHSQEHRVLERVARWRAHGALCAKFIAPLIGRISLYGDYVVLPFLRSFYDIFLLADIGPTAFRLTVELASAIQFLHDNHIAHLDIKPDNLALTSDWVLQVLDFGMSVFVTNEDQMVYGRCGTEGFMAPEIQSEGVFSPIRADRFSTGCVFLYLARLTYKDLGLDTFGKMLTNEDPLDRPALQQWRDQNSGGLYSDPALL